MPEKKKEATHSTEDKKEKTENQQPQFSGLYRSEKNEAKPLSRSTRNKVISGVAGGLGEYFNIDPTIIRIIFILMAVFGGSGIVIYLVLWLIIPSKADKSKNSQEAIKSNIEDMKSGVETFAHNLSRPQDGKDSSKFWWAIIIITLGFFFLMNNYGLLGSVDIEKLWPLALIIFGLAIILRK